MEYNREFSHTILHKYNVLKHQKINYVIDTSKQSNGSKFDSIEPSSNKKEQAVNFQKPIIKKEANNYPNNLGNNYPNKKPNYHYENKDNRNKIEIRDNKEYRDIIKDKDLDNINNLKRNLMNLKENLNSKLDEKKEPRHQLAINPSYAVNYDQKKVKNSLEIETNRTPKIVETKFPESRERRNLERKESVQTNASSAENGKKGLQKKSSNASSGNNSREHANNPNNVKRSREDISTNVSSNLNGNVISTNSSNNIKDSDKDLITVNITDRKRSDSKGSQEDQKEKISILTDFIKRMRENVRSF